MKGNLVAPWENKPSVNGDAVIEWELQFQGHQCAQEPITRMPYPNKSTLSDKAGWTGPQLEYPHMEISGKLGENMDLFSDCSTFRMVTKKKTWNLEAE